MRFAGRNLDHESRPFDQAGKRVPALRVERSACKQIDHDWQAAVADGGIQTLRERGRIAPSSPMNRISCSASGDPPEMCRLMASHSQPKRRTKTIRSSAWYRVVYHPLRGVYLEDQKAASTTIGGDAFTS